MSRKEKVIDFLVPVLSILLGFFISAIMIKATGKSPLRAYTLLFQGAFGSSFKDFLAFRQSGEALIKGALLTFTGLSVAVAFKAGLFNIGAEGQFIVGAIVAAYFGYILNISPWVNIPIILILVMIISGAYATIAAYLKIKKGIHEVITTIMLNWIAIHLVENWIVVGPFSVQKYIGQVTSAAGTPNVQDTSRLMPIFSGSRLNASIFIAIAAVIIIYFLLNRTVLGYQIQATGKNAKAAKYAGIHTERTMLISMFIAGALAGLGGACYVLGTEKHFPGVFPGGFGFDGITMALIGGGSPIGTFVTSVFFGFVRAGSTSMQLMGVHKTFTDIIQGIATLFIAAQMIIRYLLMKIGSKEKKVVVKAGG